MPNYVMNRIKFEGKQEDIDTLIRLIAVQLTDEELKEEDESIFGARDYVVDVRNRDGKKVKTFLGTIDFNRIIPQPDDIFQGELSTEAREKSHGRNWYDWSIENWGTKWNALDFEDTGNNNIISFQTAWSFPFPVILAIKDNLIVPNNLDVTMRIAYADEDIGNNLGAVLINKDSINLADFEEGSPSAINFSKIVWNNDTSVEFSNNLFKLFKK